MRQRLGQLNYQPWLTADLPSTASALFFDFKLTDWRRQMRLETNAAVQIGRLRPRMLSNPASKRVVQPIYSPAYNEAFAILVPWDDVAVVLRQVLANPKLHSKLS